MAQRLPFYESHQTQLVNKRGYTGAGCAPGTQLSSLPADIEERKKIAEEILADLDGKITADEMLGVCL